MSKPKLFESSQDLYEGEEFVMRRESTGLTPNGNPIGGRWVLRTVRGEWVDVDQYRFDLEARAGIELVSWSDFAHAKHRSRVPTPSAQSGA